MMAGICASVSLTPPSSRGLRNRSAAGRECADISHLVEQLPQVREVAGLGEELTDDGLAPVYFRQIKRGRGEPALEQPGAGGGRAAIDSAEQEASRVPRVEAKISRLRRGGGSSRRSERCGTPAGCAILRFGAEVFRRVMNHCAAAPSAGCWCDRPKPWRLSTLSASMTVLAPLVVSKW